MTRGITNRLRRRVRGIAMVEFLIVLPICLILLMATAEFGRAFMQYNTLTKAARDGVRYLASNSLMGSTGTVSITGIIQARTQNLVVYGNATGAGSPVLPGLTTADVTVVDAGGGNIRVSVVYPYGSIFAFVPGFFYGGNTDTTTYSLQTAVTMRAL